MREILEAYTATRLDFKTGGEFRFEAGTRIKSIQVTESHKELVVNYVRELPSGSKPVAYTATFYNEQFYVVEESIEKV